MPLTFNGWPKTTRLFSKPITVTEKIDGTNAAVLIEEYTNDDMFAVTYVDIDLDDLAPGLGVKYTVGAQSRNRLITPENDNYGFAQWVKDNAATLVADLGPGLHFGEWWGRGIQRGYGIDHRRFSLFNTAKWREEKPLFQTPLLDVVPVLFQGPFSEEDIRESLRILESLGSVASFGFDKPEGVCVYSEATRAVYKLTLDGDQHKDA